MKLRILLLTALGLVALCYLVGHAGFAAVMAAALEVGWGGFALLCAYQLALWSLLGLAWFVLLPDTGGRAPWSLIGARIVRDAAGELLPLSQIGGILIGARTAVLQGWAQAVAFASVIVDVTAEVLAQIAFVALGCALFSLYARALLPPAVRDAVAAGLVLLSIGGIVFLLLQRVGHDLVGRLAARILPRTVPVTASIATELDAIYASPLRVGASASLHLLGWILNAAAAWIVLALIGVHVRVGAVIAVEAVICVARSAAVLVPGALGVQEAAYVLLMPIIGVPAPIGLALSLVRRARDVVLGIPPLLVWQTLESRRLLAEPAS